MPEDRSSFGIVIYRFSDIKALIHTDDLSVLLHKNCIVFEHLIQR
jgi:hypothetical protein